MAKKILSIVLCAVLIASSVVMASAATAKSASGDTAYSNAARQLDKDYGYNGNDLGATYTKESTTFKVWAPTASKITLNRFATGSDAEKGAKDLGKTELEKELKTPGDESTFTGIWKATVEGDLVNTYYTYTITAKNVTGSKETTKETADVYSIATGVNGKRSMVCDLSKTNPDGWDKDVHVVQDRSTQSSVWEIHVKDFSFDENSGVSEANRGKFLGFTEKGTTLKNEGKVATCVDYLKDLGVTAVQINPFYDFGSIDEAAASSGAFNWGYDPVNYNVPEGSYSSNPYDGNVRIKECKAMIKALHDAGISVIMDVVYNHTFSTDSCFEYTVPNYYYHMKSDGGFSNGSGCGNETASDNLMYRNYMIQSCLYWVNEYHIDGFRFDLMGLHDCETMNLIREEMDKVNPKLTIWGEGWTGGSANFPSTTCSGTAVKQAIQSNASALNERVAFFNDGIRDGIKGGVFQKTNTGWVQGTKGSYQSVTYGILANTKSGNWHAKQPSQCVTYASCHDNQTLWDRLADSQNLTDYFRKRHPVLVAESKLTGGILAMSQGVFFTLAGEEMGRSKDNDANSYKSSPDLNKIDWSLAKSNADIVSYYKGLLDIRKHFSPLTDDTNNSQSGYLVYSGKDASYTYSAVWTNSTEGEWNKLAVLMNTDSKEATITLNEIGGNKDWVVIADDKQAGVKKLSESGNEFKLPAKSMIIAVDKASFDKVALKSDLGTVNVLAKNAVTGEVLDEYSITGKIGSTYSIAEPSVSKIYDVVGVEGSMDGKYTAEDQNVVISCGFYKPESVKKDINGDNAVNIGDVTFIQKIVAKKVTPTEAQTQLADVNLDGEVTVEDATMLQKSLAKMSVGTGKVTVNYLENGSPYKVTGSVTYEGRVGETYKLTPAKALGYAVDESKLPPSEIKIPYGEVEYNFYYNTASTDVTIRVKHSGDKTWAPTLWIWGSSEGEDSSYNYSKVRTWPGGTFTDEDIVNGWYEYKFTASTNDDAYNIIVSENGSPQSGDCKGFINNELWIVIDDSKDGINLVFYDVDPDKNPDAKPIMET